MSLDRRSVGRGVLDGSDEQPEEGVLAREQDFTLVSEVPEEGPLGDVGGTGDVSHRRGLEAPVEEQFQRRRLETLPRARLPSRHPSSVLMGPG